MLLLSISTFKILAICAMKQFGILPLFQSPTAFGFIEPRKKCRIERIYSKKKSTNIPPSEAKIKWEQFTKHLKRTGLNLSRQ